MRPHSRRRCQWQRGLLVLQRRFGASSLCGGDEEIDGRAFEQVAGSFAAFHAEFAPLFGRHEAQDRSEQYVRGLLVQQTDRRNAENVAECIDGATPRALQRLLTESPWPNAPVIGRLHAYLGPRVSAAEGVFVLDESGFPKQGQRSVGVGPQYCGVLGKVANCQMGVFLAYASARGHALVDARLFLPERWAEDAARRQAAGCPRRPPSRATHDRTRSSSRSNAKGDVTPPNTRRSKIRPASTTLG